MASHLYHCVCVLYFLRISIEIGVFKYYKITTSGSAKLAVLQEQWESCAGEWTKSSFYESIKSENRTRRQGSRRWMTRQQVRAKYGDNAVADLICDSKLKDEQTKNEQTKPHWDCPDVEAAVFLDMFAPPSNNSLDKQV